MSNEKIYHFKYEQGEGVYSMPISAATLPEAYAKWEKIVNYPAPQIISVTSSDESSNTAHPEEDVFSRLGKAFHQDYLNKKKEMETIESLVAKSHCSICGKDLTPTIGEFTCGNVETGVISPNGGFKVEGKVDCPYLNTAHPIAALSERPNTYPLFHIVQALVRCAIAAVPKQERLTSAVIHQVERFYSGLKEKGYKDEAASIWQMLNPSDEMQGAVIVRSAALSAEKEQSAEIYINENQSLFIHNSETGNIKNAFKDGWEAALSEKQNEKTCRWVNARDRLPTLPLEQFVFIRDNVGCKRLGNFFYEDGEFKCAICPNGAHEGFEIPQDKLWSVEWLEEVSAHPIAEKEETDNSTEDWRLDKYKKAIDAIYNDGVEGRNLVIKYFGLHHPWKSEKPSEEETEGEQNGWISVEKALPESNTPVLACNNQDNWLVCGLLVRGKWYNEFDESGCEIYPTHWQPLPSPPSNL